MQKCVSLCERALHKCVHKCILKFVGAGLVAKKLFRVFRSFKIEIFLSECFQVVFREEQHED